jgi:alkylation response protein AidB-like acyl-CoA dehydrogenase
MAGATHDTDLTAGYKEALEKAIIEVIRPDAGQVDAQGEFPSRGLEALAKAGILGLASAQEVGGAGHGLRTAASIVERLAMECGSTAMVTLMHYAATAVIEEHGPRPIRSAIARGEHLTTLAFSEYGSRSHFWSPVGTARRDDDATVRLDAHKSWVTSAGQADSYVWSSRPVSAEGAMTLWLVPANTPGLAVAGPFDGLGLRGNGSRPMSAENL